MGNLSSIGTVGNALSLCGMSASSSIPIIIGVALSDESTYLTTSNVVYLRSPVTLRVNTTKYPLFTMSTAPSATVTFDIGYTATYTGTSSTWTSFYSANPTIGTSAYTSSSSAGTLTGTPLTISEGTWLKIYVKTVGAALTTGVGAKCMIYHS